MTAFSINPSEHPVIFDDSWHSAGIEVTLSAPQVYAAYHALRLARKGERQPLVCRQAVKFLNQTFGRRASAAAWFQNMAAVVCLLRQHYN